MTVRFLAEVVPWSNVVARLFWKRIGSVSVNYADRMLEARSPAVIVQRVSDKRQRDGVKLDTRSKMQNPNGGLTYSTTTYCAPQMSRCARDETWQDNWLATKGLLAK
jgi:hypothetical protein